MRILYVTSDIGWPPQQGGHIRRWNVLQGLLQAGETDAVVFRSNAKPVAEEAFAGCRRTLTVHAPHVSLTDRGRLLYQSTVGRGGLVFGSALPLSYHIDNAAAVRSQLQRDIDFRGYDLVWFESPFTAMPLGRTDARASVLDADDIEYVREWFLLRRSPWYGAKILNYLDLAKLWWWERSFSRRFSFVVRCSAEDRDRHPAANNVVIPNGTLIPAAVPRSPERRVVMVGDLGYAPNAEGLEWFLGTVWPLIRQQVPDAIFDIVGKNATPPVRQAHGTSGVTVHGFVKDLAPVYRTASLSIAPLFAGGTRLKILESLAHAVPVVATHAGAFGLEVAAAHGVDRVDSPEGFAALSVALLQDPQAGVARATAGRAFVQATYDWHIIQRQVRDLVRRATAGGEV